MGELWYYLIASAFSSSFNAAKHAEHCQNRTLQLSCINICALPAAHTRCSPAGQLQLLAEQACSTSQDCVKWTLSAWPRKPQISEGMAHLHMPPTATTHHPKSLKLGCQTHTQADRVLALNATANHALQDLSIALQNTLLAHCSPYYSPQLLHQQLCTSCYWPAATR